MNPQETSTTSAAGRREEILAELQNINDLPTLPTVFLKVMSLMRNPATPMKELATTVEADPAISMKLLRLINSSFYGLARKVNSVHQAIVLLGANTLKNVIISVSIFKSMGNEDQESLFDRNEFWKHSIGCGLVARFIEKRLEIGKTEEGFIAGVIHDIGKIVLDKYFNEDLNIVMRAVNTDEISFYQAEKTHLGITHAEIGAYLAENWKLPENLVNVIAHHHKIDLESDYAQLTAVVHLSNMLARKYKVGSGGDDLIPTVDPAVWDLLGIFEEDVETWDEEIQAEIEKSQEMLSVLSK